MMNFALIGAAGFVAERHIKAIKETGNNLLVAIDQFDVMGRMDSYFPNADFFIDPAGFESYISKQQLTKQPIDYISICSPNYLHTQHIRMALHHCANVICEKPLVLYPSDLDVLEKDVKETGRKINTVLQLRLHPTIIALKQKIDAAPADKIYDIDLSYITSRGKWYFKSWKGDVNKSGGVVNNIGIHFFDMLIWIFGDVGNSTVHQYKTNKAGGFLQLKKARVRWFLSLDFDDLPQYIKEKEMRTFRSIKIEGEEIEFSDGFADLHTKTYESILNGNGFGLNAARKSILLTDQIRNVMPVGLIGDFHPFLKI